MPKIQNWSRVPDSRADVAAWTHDKKNAKVAVLNPRKYQYKVVLPSGRIKTEPTQEAAMDFARNWMRNNPMP